MNTLLNDRDEDIDELQHRQTRGDRQRDREITLGTSMILAIFFALAVLCAAFFGFGYSTGRHSALTASGPAGAAGSSSNGILKPGAGSMFGPINNPPQNTQPFKSGPVPAYSNQPSAQNNPQEASATADAPSARPTAAQRVVEDVAPAPTPAAAPTEQPKPAKVVAVSAPLPATSATGTFMVQVAAVSHQEDADLLVTTLKRRGYGVATHQEPQDKLLHVQVGPFATKKDADAMRQRLLGDGFNAIVK